MKVRVINDATLTVTAGQIVDIPDDEAARAVRLGLVEEVKEAPAKATKKK